ncbi:probable transcription-associated protein 1 [Drosophila albomicans]|uniref:Probable transcription-associated protein 1 n=1 Tax=Drosophila albomicans TaxID=7291 RepID=A0A6P8XCL9_DROAB|nr:probable transcription-associated protein 1 [Drosophila albomicans]
MTMTIATATKTTKTMMTTRRGKFSTATSVLLLCAALLLTKSLGIVALSGDGDGNAVAGQADAWSEGSGWELIATTVGTEDTETTADEALETTAEPEQESTAGPAEETTADPNEPEQETTAKPNEPEQETTASPNEPEQETTASPNEPEQETTASPNEPEQETTASPNEPATSTPSEESEATTTTEAADVITTLAPTPPAPPAFQCQAAGVYSHISGDCQRFHNCLLDDLTGELLAFDMVCPPLSAFSPSYGRCLRDVSSCNDDGFACLAAGRFAGSDDSFYYVCSASLQGGYHKYVVRCSAGTRFEPLVNRCWRYDWTQFVPGQPSLESSDLAAIKREQKQLKAEEKLRLKAEKQKEKEARKQAKLEEKLAKKAAKEQAKKDAKAKKPVSVESVESVEQASNEI